MLGEVATVTAAGMGQLVRKLPRVPRWLYDRVRWDIVYPLQLRIMKYSSYDYKTLYTIVSALTDVNPETAKAYYEEIHSKGVLDEMKHEIEGIPDLQAEVQMIERLGMEKYVRLDRTVLYCIVRALKPDVFVETGTRWGIGSYFILRAMEENQKGHLYTFDVGVAGSKQDYSWPESQSKLAFLIPSRLHSYLTIVEGDSARTLPAELSKLPGVDIFYHDSLHTYEHMMKEFEIVFPHMKAGGLFMSEDTDANEAWDVFIRDKRYKSKGEYCSHLGLEPGRDVSAIRLY
jgi:cephalosporin hydroxylase